MIVFYGCNEIVVVISGSVDSIDAESHVGVSRWNNRKRCPEADQGRDQRSPIEK